MKNTKPELFRSALKIILVGTGNVLSPHKYFQFERMLKNVIVNSESAFWGFFWRATFLDLVKVLEGRALQGKEPHLGGPLGVAVQAWWSSLELHMAPPFA